MTKEEEFDAKWSVLVDNIGNSSLRLNKRKVVKIEDNYFARCKGSNQSEFSRLIRFRKKIVNESITRKVIWTKFVISKGRLKEALLFGEDGVDELKELKKAYASKLEEYKSALRVLDMQGLMRDDDPDEESIDDWSDYVNDDIIFLGKELNDIKKSFAQAVKEQRTIETLLKYFETIKI